MEKFFVDAEGKYLGVFIGAQPPEGAIEVESCPSDGRQKWDGSHWCDVEVSIKAKDDIFMLEKQITPRRLREAFLTETGREWLVGIEEKIEELRFIVNNRNDK